MRTYPAGNILLKTERMKTAPYSFIAQDPVVRALPPPFLSRDQVKFGRVLALRGSETKLGLAPSPFSCWGAGGLYRGCHRRNRRR